MDNDKYGRLVDMETIGIKDHYTVSDPITEEILFKLAYPTGKPEADVYSIINSMAPADYVDDTPIRNKTGYIGSIEIEDDAAGPSTVALPVDKITGETVCYTFGAGKIEMHLNGQQMAIGKDFNEIDAEDGNCNEVEVLFSLFEGDYLEFRIR